MVLALFAFRVRPGVEATFQTRVARMAELVQRVPGFISMDLFTSQDGRTLAIPRFETEAALLEWRSHPEHLAAQREGKESFFDEYSIDVCSVIRSYDFHR